MITLIDKIGSFIRYDWRSHRLRFVLEVCGVTCNIIASVLLAVTAQDPWLAHCLLYTSPSPRDRG